MTATTDPKATMPIERAYEHVCTWLKKRGPDAQKNIMAHLRTVTGRSLPLPVYHTDVAITEDAKRDQYRLILRALIDHNYALLQGQSNTVTQPIVETIPNPALITKNKKAAQVTTPKPPESTTEDSIPQPTVEVNGGADDDLTKLLLRRILPHLSKLALDEEHVRNIARLEMINVPTGIDETKVADIALETVRHALSNGEFPEARVKKLIDNALVDFIRPVVLTTPQGEARKLDGIFHLRFETLIKMAQARDNTYLVGPAASGKTTAAKQLSEALSLPFYFNGAIDTEYKLKGFIDANSKLISPPFRRAFENGGIYLFDEVDASLPAAVLAFNAALSNDRCDFPDACIQRHKDFICIAAGNTWGNGATFDYVGRAKQDAAFLDRFATLPWDYDEKMELALCANKEWCKFVQQCRANARTHGLKVIISPRASIFGERLLAAGVDRETVIITRLRKGMTDEQWNKINPK